MKQNHEFEWKNELNDSNRKNLPFFIYGSIVGILIYSVFDYFSIYNEWFIFLVLRLSCSFIGIILLWANKNQKISSQNAVIVFLLCCYLFFSYGASIQTTLNQLMTWNISIVVAGFFWPYFILVIPKRITLVLSLFFFITYALFYFLLSKFSIQTLLVQGGIFFLFGILASYIIAYSKYKMHYNNFKLRQILILSKKELEITNKNLQKINQVKNKLFSIIAHDLRSPFNSLIGFSDLLLEQVTQTADKDIHKYASIINNGLNKTYNYLNNLLEWSRLQSNEIEYYPTNFNVTDLFEEVKELSLVQAQNKRISIKQILTQQMQIFADRNMIKIVLINLLSNAIKFSNEGADIIISGKQDDKQVKVFVEDNGVGMSKESIEKLFLAEESFSTPGTNNEKGTGFGLLLCNDFIKKHGGQIDVKSEIGKGSVFCICLPINVGNE